MHIKKVRDLINLKQEGSYWDFKREWYSEQKKADLLHDIICMANNLSNRDGYIIIGIDQETDFQITGVSKDPNRKNTQKIVDFLKKKPFSGDVRPLVRVETHIIDKKEIDVIVVENSDMTPFFLTSAYWTSVNILDTIWEKAC